MWKKVIGAPKRKKKMKERKKLLEVTWEAKYGEKVREGFGFI